jgi:mevalonate kinase
MVGYSSFGLIAVKGVQELKAEKDAEIGALRSQNSQLLEKIQLMQSSIEDLTKRLESLESQ